jgi:enoyl-CoA hydratase
MSEAKAAGEPVMVEVRDGIAWITLNRPDAMNTISDAVRRGLPAALAAADEDPEVRVIVLRGAGERAFCAGADVKEFRKVESPMEYRQGRVHGHWIAAFERVRKPVVASIRGWCLGGGLEIALACDLRVAARDAVFALPETGLGILPGAGGTQRITRALGTSLAMDMVLTGRRLDAAEALAHGLVSRVVDVERLADETARVAAAIAAKPPMAIRFAKEAVRAGREMTLSEGLRLEVDLLTLLVNSEDAAEAANAFREKRPPKFTGR